MAKAKLSMEDILEVERTFSSKSRKPKDMNAPKRPQSGFFLWANSRRPALMEENPDMRLADIGKKLGTEWKTVDAATKEAFNAKYLKAKATHDKKMEKYYKTDEYHKHRIAAYAWRIHETKKPFRKDENAPKRPMSGYMLYTNAVRDGLMKGNDDMTYTSVLKEISNMWKALSADERTPWENKAAKAKKEYQAVREKYEKTNEYKKYVEERAAYKEEQVKTRHRLMKVKKKEKRSKSVDRTRAKARSSSKKSRSPRRRSKGRRAARRQRRRARSARTPKSPKRSSSRRRSAKRRSSRRSRTPKARKRSSSRSTRRSSSRKAKRGRKARKRSGRRARTPTKKRRSSSRSKSARRGARRARKARGRRRAARKAKKPVESAASGTEASMTSANDTSVAE